MAERRKQCDYAGVILYTFVVITTYSSPKETIVIMEGNCTATFTYLVVCRWVPRYLPNGANVCLSLVCSGTINQPQKPSNQKKTHWQGRPGRRYGSSGEASVQTRPRIVLFQTPW